MFKRGDVVSLLNFWTNKPTPDFYYVLASPEDLTRVCREKGMNISVDGMAICSPLHYSSNRHLTASEINAYLMNQVSIEPLRGIHYVTTKEYVITEASNVAMKYVLEKAED